MNHHLAALNILVPHIRLNSRIAKLYKSEINSVSVSRSNESFVLRIFLVRRVCDTRVYDGRRSREVAKIVLLNAANGHFV